MENLNFFYELFTINNRLSKLLMSEDKKLAKQFYSLQNKILFTIYQNKVISPSSLVRELKIAKSNIAKFCRVLVDKNLITDKVDKNDHRIIYYNITSKGEKYILNFTEKINKIFSKFFDDNQLDEISKLTNKILNILMIDGE